MQTYLRAVRDRDSAAALASFTEELRVIAARRSGFASPTATVASFARRSSTPTSAATSVEVDVRIAEPGGSVARSAVATTSATTSSC